MASRVISLGFSPNTRPSSVMKSEKDSSMTTRQQDAAQLQNVPKEKAGAQQHDAGFEPELVGRHSRAENRRDADRVRDHKPDQDRPENVLDVGKTS